MPPGIGAEPVEDTQDGEPVGEGAIAALQPRLLALLWRWTADADRARDLAQDVMLRLVQAVRAGRVRSAAALPAYAHRVARNSLLMDVRSPVPEPVADVPEVLPMWAVAAPTPADLYERAELGRLALRALDGLATERDRALIRAFYVDGVDKLELMRRHGLDRDHFDRVISRARSRMRELCAHGLPKRTDAPLRAREPEDAGTPVPTQEQP